ncbi:MAG TPA: hypothetical protein VMQ17_05780 [Candidatus Sulfotelmatobacter sp.]|nr:hypothetical protein [Candidatus Sulfotelmatobacter sp.]
MTPTKKSEPKPKESTSTPAPTTAAQAPQAPKPAAITAQPQPANKQLATVAKLKAAWTEKGIKLDQLTERQDGKFMLLQPTTEWPIVRVGPTGGIELPQIRSYARAWDAAVDGLAVWTKQQQRDQKKAASSAPAQATKSQSAPAAKPETPAIRKARKDAALETALA